VLVLRRRSIQANSDADPALRHDPAGRARARSVRGLAESLRQPPNVDLDQLAVQVSVGAVLLPLYAAWNPKLALPLGANAPL
jgi:hypothetical protein